MCTWGDCYKQTQKRLYSLQNQNPRFSTQLWKARLQASVKKPDALVTAATQRLWETSVSLTSDKPRYFFNWMETTEAFFLCFSPFCQPIQTPLAPFILLPLDCILPLLSIHYSTWLFPGWIQPAVNLEDMRLYLERPSLPREASWSGSQFALIYNKNKLNWWFSI